MEDRHLFERANEAGEARHLEHSSLNKKDFSAFRNTEEYKRARKKGWLIGFVSLTIIVLILLALYYFLS